MPDNLEPVPPTVGATPPAESPQGIPPASHADSESSQGAKGKVETAEERQAREKKEKGEKELTPTSSEMTPATFGVD